MQVEDDCVRMYMGATYEASAFKSRLASSARQVSKEDTAMQTDTQPIVYIATAGLIVFDQGRWERARPVRAELADRLRSSGVDVYRRIHLKNLYGVRTTTTELLRSRDPWLSGPRQQITEADQSCCFAHPRTRTPIPIV